MLVDVHFRRADSKRGVKELVALRKGILKAEQEGNTISLAGGAEWPQLGAVPLFVRHFYDACYTGPLQSLTADGEAKRRKFVILGNPGSECLFKLSSYLFIVSDAYKYNSSPTFTLQLASQPSARTCCTGPSVIGGTWCTRAPRLARRSSF